MASSPSPAVATTRNSPVSASPPPSTSTSTRRISALSSATTTVGLDGGFTGAHGPDFHAAVLDVKPDAAAALASDRLAQDGDGSDAQRGARGQHVPLAHLNRALRDQLAEHTGTAGQFGDEAPGAGAQ